MSLEWLKTYSSLSTVRAYRWGLEQFFKVLGFKGSLEDNARAYLSQKRNYKEDLRTFFVSLKDKPPKSADICMRGVKVFFIENGIKFPALFWKRFRSRHKGSRALMLKNVLNNAELRSILSHMDVKGRSLFLVLASSGMRMSEALKLRVEDVDLSADPPRINIRGEYTKTGNSRIVFISSEAKEALQEWLKIRENELQKAIRRSTKHPKKASDNRIWPFENNTAYYIWRNAITKSGFAQRFQNDNGLRKFAIHPHVLRKFFRMRMTMVVPVNVVEALMGHGGYLNEVYRCYSLEELANFYKQGEYTLLIFVSEEILKLRAKIEEHNKQLQTLINRLVSESIALKKRVTELENIIAEYKKDFWTKIDKIMQKIHEIERLENKKT